MNAQDFTSTRPYLIRALYEWCTDNGFTPYLVVRVNDSVQVPREYVNNGEIVLNVSYDATSALQMGNEFIEFKARFGGEPRDIMIPVHRVVAIYARENGQGMAFALEDEVVATPPGVQRLESLKKRADAKTPSIKSVERGPVQLQSVENMPDDDDDEDDETPPPRPPSGGGRRPVLKRVK